MRSTAEKSQLKDLWADFAASGPDRIWPLSASHSRVTLSEMTLPLLPVNIVLHFSLQTIGRIAFFAYSTMNTRLIFPLSKLHLSSDEV